MKKQSVLTFMLISFFAWGWAVAGWAQERQPAMNQELNSLEGEALNIPSPLVSVMPKTEDIDVLNLQDVDLRAALKWLEDKTGFRMKLRTTREITGTISLQIQNIGLWDALKIILRPLGLAFTREGGDVLIMTADEFQQEFGNDFMGQFRMRSFQLKFIDKEEWMAKLNALKSEEGKIFTDTKSNALIVLDSIEHLTKIERLLAEVDVPLMTEVFYLKYSLVADLKEKVLGMLTPQLGQADFNERANTVVVTDAGSKIQQIRDFVRDVDQKVDVEIVAELLQIRLDETHKQGIDWEAIVSNYQFAQLHEQKRVRGEKKLSAGTITEEDYDVLLEALEAVGEVFRIAYTRVQTVVNTPVGLHLSSRDQPEEETLTAGLKNLVSISQKFDTNEVDVHLVVNPRIRDQKKLVAQIQAPAEWILRNSMPGADVQQVYSSFFPFEIALEPSEQIILGGVNQEQEVSGIKKVPVLGNLPFVGFVFRKRNKFFENIEYVVFLKPRVLKSGQSPNP